MFLLVSIRHVGAHPGEHQHGVSIQISISLGKTFLRISRIRNIPLTWILARVFVYAPTFISQILYFIYWTVLILIYYLFLMAWYWKPAIAVLGQPLPLGSTCFFFFFFYSLSSTKSVLYFLPFNCRIYIYHLRYQSLSTVSFDGDSVREINFIFYLFYPFSPSFHHRWITLCGGN